MLRHDWWGPRIWSVQGTATATEAPTYRSGSEQCQTCHLEVMPQLTSG